MLLELDVLFLLLAVLARRSSSLRKYWEIPFAFFVFTIPGVVGDQAGFIQQTLVRNVLHETPNANNPLASTVIGSVLVQLVSTASLVIWIANYTQGQTRGRHELRLLPADLIGELVPHTVHRQYHAPWRLHCERSTSNGNRAYS